MLAPYVLQTYFSYHEATCTLLSFLSYCYPIRAFNDCLIVVEVLLSKLFRYVLINIHHQEEIQIPLLFVVCKLQ